MKINASVLFILLSLSVSANVEFTPTKQIVLTGGNCTELEGHASSIMSWTKSIYSTIELKMPKCYCADDECLMDVYAISPAHVKEMTNFGGEYTSSHSYEGPNCFNAAMVATQSIPAPYFTHPAELRAILDSSMCQERGINEQLQPGDTIIIRDPSKSEPEVHAGIYLSEDLSFNKYGQSKLMPYSYGIDIAKSYGVRKSECRRVAGTPKQGAPCFQEVYANYYRCKPLYSFVSSVINSSEGLSEDVRKLYADSSWIVNTISAIAFTGRAVTEKELKGHQKKLKRLYKDASAISKLGELQMSFARILKYRALSLFVQTRIIAKSKGFTKLADATLN